MQLLRFRFKKPVVNIATLSEFQINRSNPALNVGFEPYAPVVVSFPATTATNFRLVIKNAKPNSGLVGSWYFAASPRVER